MNSLKEWIKHLQHPLVFAGFALFVMLEIFQMFFRDSLAARLSGTALETLLDKGMTFAFVLALVSVIGGIALSFRKGGDEQHDSGASKSGDCLSTKGRESPAVKAGGNVTMSYGGAACGRKKALRQMPRTRRAMSRATADCLKTEGERSPAFKAEGDVEIKYEK
ncbi:MAG: hypothetical protein ACTFAK_13245 [Candidatus Electronema sp. VV]